MNASDDEASLTENDSEQNAVYHGIEVLLC